MDDSSGGVDFKSWHDALQKRRSAHEQWIQYARDHPHYDEDRIRALDSTLKKVTAFMKRVKNIGSTVTPESLLPELAKLNLSKFVDEIASSVCDAKLKVEELPSLVEFCVKAASVYGSFSENLLGELRKRVPTKRADKITNASKLRVDLKFLSELILCGVAGTDGIQLLGSLLSFLINTDKQEHVNVPILLPFCQTNLFECSGLIPLSCQKTAGEQDLQQVAEQLPSVVSKEQRSAISNLFKAYMDSLVEHANAVRLRMNAALKSIKRQERTRGDAAPEDRQTYGELKTSFDRLLASAVDLSQWVGVEVPEMPEELSDDELEEAEVKKNGGETTTRVSPFADEDTRLFYEKLANVEQAAMLARNSPTVEDEAEQEAEEFGVTDIEVLVDNIDLEDLESGDETEAGDNVTEPEEEEPPPPTPSLKSDVNRDAIVLNPLDNVFGGVSANFSTFLTKLCNAINKERIDAAALEFITHFNKHANRKRLVQHFLAAPYDRLDLLPFYCRFMATIKRVVSWVPNQVVGKLLERFREIADRKCVPSKTKVKKKDSTVQHTDAKVHLSKYISEMVKFGLLPKAQGLACMRSLLVDLRQFKVDMLSAMIESMGYFLFNSTETHAKMKVFVDVLRSKSEKIKDTRQKLLLENAYFAVMPTDDDSIPIQRRPPLEEFISMKIMALKSVKSSLHALRRIDWANEETCEFTLGLLSNATTVPFGQLERLAKLVGNLTDFQPWVGVYVVDDLLEFIRLALELNDNSLYQRLFSSVVYLGQLFNYTVCGTFMIFKVMYQLISYNINGGQNLMLDCALRVRRVRLAIEMVKTVGEYFGEGRPKERMDCFLNFLFLFFYDTKESWTPELTEEFGEFPHDVVHELQKLLATFRRKDKSKFPDSLEKAREAVARIQAKYRDKANLLYQQTGQLTQPDIEQEELPRKGKGHKDDEDEDAERAPTPQLEANGDVETAKEVEDRASPLTVDFHDNEHKFSVDEDFDVTMQHEADPEDDDLLRDIERAMNETYQAASVVQKQTNIDLEVPPSARQKFERKITFAEETKNRAEVVEEPEAPRVQMALMTRKGNRKVLKAVNVAPSQGMHEALLEMRAQNERERKELKALTLAMDERIANQQHPELNTNNTPLNQPLPRPSNVSPPHPQIPAGPQRPAPYGRFASTSRDSGT